MVKNPPANAGDIRDLGLIYGSGRSPGGGHGNLLQLQYSCLKSSRDRGAWWATVHRIAKSQTRLKRLNTHTRGRPCDFTGSIGPQVLVPPLINFVTSDKLHTYHILLKDNGNFLLTCSCLRNETIYEEKNIYSRGLINITLSNLFGLFKKPPRHKFLFHYFK